MTEAPTHLSSNSVQISLTLRRQFTAPVGRKRCRQRQAWTSRSIPGPGQASPGHRPGPKEAPGCRTCDTGQVPQVPSQLHSNKLEAAVGTPLILS